jgi:hypothetical protein
VNDEKVEGKEEKVTSRARTDNENDNKETGREE